MKLHILKIKGDYYYPVRKGLKKAELRKNDRDYQELDLIHFVDTNGNEFFQEPNNIYQITHILSNADEYGLDKDYVILSIEKLSEED